MRLEELMNEHYDEFNENDLHILKYVLNHKATSSQMSINQLAEACHTSRSSVHRLTKKLNFAGYSEFKVFLKWESQPAEQESRHTEILTNDIEATMKNLADTNFELLSNKLVSARRIFIYGSGTAQLTCATEAQRLFAVVNTFVTIIHDQVEFETMFPSMSDEDIIIIVSLSGDTPALLPQARKLNAKGIEFISITNLKNNKLAQLSPAAIYVTSSPTATEKGAGLASFIPFHIAIETLIRHFAEYLNV
ncbi:RpiR family transcriptional regulator [Salsuginibacillus halophilus]|uniref:RpiR family transcriptional regulator n=1 Tax=Salsuginibacillus halophilus TaxID=517424 RepID=A0A2P8HE68_9BACI|nr:MurR/RpiR family transcriptional regulator [Salsuginibacillus halophilus]PSL44504.1 RpiR family transcriptional regulator [Salsuginibacillus halophilus]